MKARRSIKLKVKTLQEAIAPIVPRERRGSRRGLKPYVLDLRLDAASGCLRISEARYAEFGTELPAIGRWPARAPGDPVEKRRELHDTWGFSAHVPMPPLTRKSD
jgi:hypothetical protein